MGETPQATTEQPSVIFSPVDHWESLSDEEEAIWRKELRQYGVISSCAILNVAPLSFLRTFRLLEVRLLEVRPSKDMKVWRSYALIRLFDGKPEIHPCDDVGSVPSFIWEAPELQLDETTVNQYLRFHIWVE